MSEYLLADAQPAMSTPITDTDDRPMARKMPGVEVGEVGVGPERHHHHEQERGGQDDVGRQREQLAVGVGRGDVLLLEELAHLGEELERAVGPGLHRAEPALHVAHHLEEEGDDERARAEDDEDQHRDRARHGLLPVGQLDRAAGLGHEAAVIGRCPPG